VTSNRIPVAELFKILRYLITPGCW